MSPMGTGRKLVLLGFVLAMACTLPACGEAGSHTRTVKTISGQEVKVPDEIKRIATVYGPSYESMVVLGAEDKIVLCSDVQRDNFPWAQVVFKRIRIVPYLENVHTAVNVEAILPHHPDIVFGFPRDNEERKLKEARLASVPGRTGGTLDEVKGLLFVYAEALGGDAVGKAQQYADYFDSKLQYVKAITSAIPDESRPAVYFAGIDLLTTYGNLSDIPELIHAAGGRAVTAELKAGERTPINFEQLAAYNPDYIFIDHGGINDRNTVEELLGSTYSDGRYNMLTAVKQKQVYLSPSGVYYWDMGLQKILLLLNMAKILHPDLFADLDMKAELQYFYKTFYQYNLTSDEAGKILNRENPDNYVSSGNSGTNHHNHGK